jgi:hypothetical protein
LILRVLLVSKGKRLDRNVAPTEELSHSVQRSRMSGSELLRNANSPFSNRPRQADPVQEKG